MSLMRFLEEGAKYCVSELLPINRDGDEIGCTWDNGVVRTPLGLKRPMISGLRGAGRAYRCPRIRADRACPTLSRF